MSVVSQYCSISTRSFSRHPSRSALHDGSLARANMRSPKDLTAGIALGAGASWATAEPPQPNAKASMRIIAVRFVLKTKLLAPCLDSDVPPIASVHDFILTDPRRI